MAIDADSSYRYLGGRAALALEVTGPTMESCLARAVEGVAAAFAEVHPSVTGRPFQFEVDAAPPATMLRDVLDVTSSMRSSGDVPVSVDSVELIGDRLLVSLEVVAAGTARVRLDVPPTLDWHLLALERRDGHWVGRLVAEP